MGQEVEQDRSAAFYWFTQSADQGNEYAQFFLGRWDAMGSPSVMLSVTRLLHRIAQTFREAPLPRDATAMQLRLDRKRLEQLREKKQAMGHKANDHPEQVQTWGGMGGMSM